MLGFDPVLLVVELLGQGPQVHGHLLGFRVAVLPLQRPAEPGEDLGPRQVRRGRQALRRLQVVELPGAQQLLPQPGSAAEHQGHPFGIIGRSELGDGRLRQGQPAFRLAGPAGGVCGELEHADVIQAGRAGASGHAVPQVEHLLEHPQPLRVRQGRPRGGRRPPCRRQRTLVIVRAAPVQRGQDHEGAFRPGPRADLQPGLLLHGEGAVRLGALARQHLRQHRLTDQLMPEGVSVSVADQHVSVDGRAQGGRQGCVIEPGHGREQQVTQARATHGGDPQRLLCPFRQHRDRGQQQIPQGCGQLGADRSIGVHQGLGEQRDTAAALVHLAHQRGVRCPAQDALELDRGLGAGQPGQFQA